MMKCLLMLSTLLGTVSAFSIVAAPPIRRLSSTSLYSSFPKAFERAIQCAENHGLCDVEELMELADELESYQGCYFKADKYPPEVCKKEEMDRLDVAEILRMEMNLQLRKDYLKNGNLFKSSLEEARNAEARDNVKELREIMDMYSEY